MKKKDQILLLAHLPTDQIQAQVNCSKEYVLRILEGNITPREQKQQKIIELAHLPKEKIMEIVGCTRPYVHAILRRHRERIEPQYFEHSNYYRY